MFETNLPVEPYHQLVANIIVSDKREAALQELSKKREKYPDLAPVLWYSFGTIAALLQEITDAYPLLQPATLTAHESNRVCNALALLQCVASHQDTRKPFLAAQIPMYLYPFLNSITKTKPFEYLRLTSLGVIGALVKIDDGDVIKFLLSTEIIPLSLRIMETGSDLSKTVATFIVQKILQDGRGLDYMCQTHERFNAVSNVLNNMIRVQADNPDLRLMKHIFKCYSRLLEHQNARNLMAKRGNNELKEVLNPTNIRAFETALAEDVITLGWLKQLIYFTQFKQ